MRRPVTGRVHPVTVLSIAVSSACLLMIIIVGPSSALPHHTFPGVHNPFGDPSLYPEYYGPEAETTTPYPRRNRHRDSSYWEPYRPDSSVVDDSGRSNRHQVSGSSRMDLAETSHTAQDSTNSGDSSSSASTAPRDGSNSAGVTGADSNKAFAFPNHNFTLPKLYEMYWKLRQEGKTLKEHFENAPLVPEIYGMNIRDGHGRRRRKFSIDEVAAVVAAAMRLSSPSGAASINEQQYPAINPRESLPSHRDTRNAATQGSHPQQGYVTDGVGHNRALDHPVVPDIVRPARESNPGYPDVDDAGVLEQQGQQHQFIDSISLLHPEAAELLRPYYNEQHGAAEGLVPHGHVDQFSTYQPSAMLYPRPSHAVYQYPNKADVDYYWRLRQEEEKRLQQVKYNIRNRINPYAPAVRRDFWETTDDPTAGLLSSTGTWEAASGAQNTLPFHDEINSSVPGPLRPAVADRTAFVEPAEEPLVPDLDAIPATHIHRARSWPLLCGVACAQPGRRTPDRKITPVNVLWGPFIAQGFNRQGTPSRPNPISGNGARKSPSSIPTVEQPTVLEGTTTTKPIPPQPSTALNPAFADYYEDENVADDIDAARTTTTTRPRPLSPTVNPAFADYYEDDRVADQDDAQGGEKVSAKKRPFNQPLGEVVNGQPAADTSFKQESEDGSRFSPTTSASQPDALLDTGINTQSLNVVRVTEGGNADDLVKAPTAGQNAPGSLHSRILNGPHRPDRRTPRPTKEPLDERIRGQPEDDGPKTNKPSNNMVMGSGAGGSSSLAHRAVDCESCVRRDQERKAKNTETFESELKRIAGNRREQEEEDRQALMLDELEDSNRRESDFAQRTGRPSMPKTTPRKGRPSSSDFEIYNLPGPMPSAASSRSDVRVEEEEKTANSGKGRINNDGSKFVPNFDQKEQVYRNLAEADQEESVPDGGDGLDFLNDATAVQPSTPAKSVLLAPTDGQSQPRAEQPATAVVQPKGVFASIFDGAKWLGSKVQQTAQNAYQTIATGLEPAAAIAPADGGPLRSSSVATNQVPAGNTLTNYNKSPHDKYPETVSFELSLIRRRRQVASSSSTAVKNDNEDFAIDARDFEPPSHLTEEERRTWKRVVGLAKDYASRFSGIVVVDPQQQQEDSLDNRKAVIVDTAKANRKDFVDKIGQAWSIAKDEVVENIDALGDALNQQ